VFAKSLAACTHLPSTVSQLFEPQVQKIAIFTYRSPHFCFPWRRPCTYHAVCCMDRKGIQCLPNPSQHVPIYLQQFPSYVMLKSMRKSKNRYFHVMQPTFLFPLEMHLRLSCNMLHGWKDNSMLAKPLAACTHLSSIVSRKCQKSPFSSTAAHIFVSPGDAPAIITQYIASI